MYIAELMGQSPIALAPYNNPALPDTDFYAVAQPSTSSTQQAVTAPLHYPSEGQVNVPRFTPPPGFVQPGTSILKQTTSATTVALPSRSPLTTTSNTLTSTSTTQTISVLQGAPSNFGQNTKLIAFEQPAQKKIVWKSPLTKASSCAQQVVQPPIQPQAEFNQNRPTYANRVAAGTSSNTNRTVSEQNRNLPSTSARRDDRSSRSDAKAPSTTRARSAHRADQANRQATQRIAPTQQQGGQRPLQYVRQPPLPPAKFRQGLPIPNVVAGPCPQPAGPILPTSNTVGGMPVGSFQNEAIILIDRWAMMGDGFVFLIIRSLLRAGRTPRFIRPLWYQNEMYIVHLYRQIRDADDCPSHVVMSIGGADTHCAPHNKATRSEIEEEFNHLVFAMRRLRLQELIIILLPEPAGIPQLRLQLNEYIRNNAQFEERWSYTVIDFNQVENIFEQVTLTESTVSIPQSMCRLLLNILRDALQGRALPTFIHAAGDLNILELHQPVGELLEQADQAMPEAPPVEQSVQQAPPVEQSVQQAPPTPSEIEKTVDASTSQEAQKQQQTASTMLTVEEVENAVLEQIDADKMAAEIADELTLEENQRQIADLMDEDSKSSNSADSNLLTLDEVVDPAPASEEVLPPAILPEQMEEGEKADETPAEDDKMGDE